MSKEFKVSQDYIDNEYQSGKSRGMREERERIIGDILESEWKCGHPDCDADKTEVCYPRQELFAIIRGETK